MLLRVFQKMQHNITSDLKLESTYDMQVAGTCAGQAHRPRVSERELVGKTKQAVGACMQ